MRFGIKDLLGITLLVALVLLLVRGNQQVQQTTLKIVEVETRRENAEIDLERAKNNLTDIDAELDYFKEIARLHEDALPAFEKIKSKYNAIDPKPEWIGYRIQPVLIDQVGQMRWAFRISVPKEFPVFLRSAVVSLDSLPSQTRTGLDSQSWIQDPSTSGFAPHEIQITPGIHEIAMTTTSGKTTTVAPTIEISLDGNRLMHATVQDPGYQFRSTMSTAPKEQRNFQLKPYATSRAPST
ncbi:hypothetical protein LOC67_15360 [Stieleria sp. JC731]|uniref:hypothetical protein n=1 Tax=Pirellulaceae TaxID=2691357 RepID=UPI001E35E441|nr:hypothetical protein [Stieleria sp. JC731]MCC9601938.1 hypothetical protein [Stieleria sp. JC731]